MIDTIWLVPVAVLGGLAYAFWTLNRLDREKRLLREELGRKGD